MCSRFSYLMFTMQINITPTFRRTNFIEIINPVQCEKPTIYVQLRKKLRESIIFFSFFDNFYQITKQQNLSHCVSSFLTKSQSEHAHLHAFKIMKPKPIWSRIRIWQIIFLCFNQKIYPSNILCFKKSCEIVVLEM